MRNNFSFRIRLKYHIETACLPLPLQSSCTTPCLEAESAHLHNMQGLSHLNYRSASNLSDEDNEKYENNAKINKSPVNPERKTGGMSHVYIPTFYLS